MEQSQLMKNVNMLKQENRKVRGHCVLLLRRLWELKLISKNQQENTSDHQTQQQQVGTGSWVRLVLLTISHWTPCLFTAPPILLPIPFLIHIPNQPPTSRTVIVYFSVYAHVFWDVSLF